MKGIIETSVYLVIFALVCFFSIDFIRINQRVSDAGEISQYIADVAKLDLNVVLVAQDVIDLNARKTDVQRVDAELCGVEVEDRVAVAQLLAEGVVAAHGVDLFAGILGHVSHLMEHLPAPQREVPPGDVEAGHEQVAAGGSLGQVDDLAHIAGVDVGADEQQARLR